MTVSEMLRVKLGREPTKGEILDEKQRAEARRAELCVALGREPTSDEMASSGIGTAAKVIIGVFVTGAAALAAYAGFEWVSANEKRDKEKEAKADKPAAPALPSGPSAAAKTAIQLPSVKRGSGLPPSPAKNPLAVLFAPIDDAVSKLIGAGSGDPAVGSASSSSNGFAGAQADADASVPADDSTPKTDDAPKPVELKADAPDSYGPKPTEPGSDGTNPDDGGIPDNAPAKPAHSHSGGGGHKGGHKKDAQGATPASGTPSPGQSKPNAPPDSPPPSGKPKHKKDPAPPLAPRTIEDSHAHGAHPHGDAPRGAAPGLPLSVLITPLSDAFGQLAPATHDAAHKTSQAQAAPLLGLLGALGDVRLSGVDPDAILDEGA